MRILEANPVISRMLVTEEDYNKLKEFFGDEVSEQLAEEYDYVDCKESKYYKKTDYTQEKSGLCIVIDEENEIWYEIVARKVSFEGFMNECFEDYNGLGYDDNLIGAYEYVGQYGYILSIENWTEDKNYDVSRMTNLFDLIETRLNGIDHEGAEILRRAIYMFREELNIELKIDIVEYKTKEYVRPNPGISRHYSIKLTNNIYELIRDLFKARAKKGEVELVDLNVISVRNEDDEYTDIYLHKENQEYRLDFVKYEDYEKGKYFDREYNEYVLPDKEVLIGIFESLKTSRPQLVQHYDFVPYILIDAIKKYID